VKGVGSPLIVANKDGSFSRVLIEVQTPYEVSPELRYVAFNKSGGVYVAFLGLREEPKTNFRLELDKTRQLNENQKEQFEKYFKGGTIDGYFDKHQSFTIWGNVYSPKFNPLNNRVIGPDKDKFKGWVMFIESNDSFSIVKTTFEIKPIKEGDIVSNIYSDSIMGRSFGLSSKIWAVLKYGNGAQRNEKEDKTYLADANLDKSKLIMGSWKSEYSKTEYFRDGTFISNAYTGKRYTGTWSIEGNILRLQFINPLRKLQIYTIIEMTDSTYKIKLDNNDKYTSNARRIEPIKQSPVYTIKNSRTYHKRNCSELNTDDLIEFASSQKAQEAGGVPCKNCNPSVVVEGNTRQQDKPGKSRTTYEWIGWKSLFKSKD